MRPHTTPSRADAAPDTPPARGAGGRSTGDMLFAIGSKALYAITRVGLPPLTLAHVGLAEYGLWATCFVLVSYLGMTASGFTLVYLRHVARHHAQADTAAISRLLSTGILTMGALGLVLLAALYLGLPGLLSAFRVDESQRELAAQLWLGTCAIFLADMSLGAFGNVLHAVGRVRQEQKVWMASFLLETLCIVALLHAGWGTRGLLAAFAVRYLFSVSMAAWLAHRALPGLRLSPALADRSLLREFFGYGTSVQIAGLMATALHSADRLLAGALVGPQATAVFDLATKLPTTAASAPSSVSGVAVSAAARHDAQGDREGMKRLYGDASRMTVLSLGLLLPFLVAFAEPLTWLWLGPVPAREQVAPVMALLGFGLCWHMMTGPASALFRGRGVMRAEYAYHGLRAVVLSVGVAAWWWGSPTHELIGLAVAVAVAQTVAAWLYLAASHRVLTGAMRGVVTAMLLPMGGALALAWGLSVALEPWMAAALQVPSEARRALVWPLLGAGALWGGLFAALVWFVRAIPRLGAALAVALGLAACAGMPPDRLPAEAAKFVPATKSDRVEFLDPKALADLELGIDPVYRVGPGDVLGLQVLSRPELSSRHTVGPDGRITVPVAGAVTVADLSREEAGKAVAHALDRYYVKPAVVLGVEQYTAHRVSVLGRVQVPGQLAFDHPPTLLEALAKAGSLPVIDKQATLTRCAIFRGRDRIIWVDLKRLLNGGETAYNIRLAKGDLVYIPDSSDTMVYVLGAVHRPGAYRLTPDMSVMDALSQAGGPNDDGNGGRIGVYRPGRKLAETISLANLYKADRRVNFGLEEGDVIYVPKTGIAEFGYVSRQLAAGLSLLTVGSLLGL